MVVMSENEITKYKELVEGMLREELENQVKTVMEWLYDCFRKYEEFKSTRDDRRTMYDFTGVRNWLYQFSLASERLAMYLERLFQIAKEEVVQREKFDRGES